jgi:RNA polymerase sigma factor for flagellar operon FliA
LPLHDAAIRLTNDQLVDRFAPLVKRMACRLKTHLPASVQIDDLVQNGMMGLCEAYNRFETGMGAQFETYGVHRVRGAMLDGLRENDWLPRSCRRDSRRIELAISRLEQRNGRVPRDEELADSLGVTLGEYQRMARDSLGHELLFFEDMFDEGGNGFLERYFFDDANEPSQLLEERRLHQLLVAGVEALPDREKLLMTLYYEQDLNLREIGALMGVTESRVCQLHNQAVARLRVCLLDEIDCVKTV